MTKINLMPKKSWKTKAFKALSVVSQVTLIFQMSYLGVFLAPNQARAAEVPSNEVSISMFGLILSSPYSLVAGQPTGTGELKNGNVKAYPEGACIPFEFEVTNKSATAGDILVSPVIDYFNGVVGLTNVENVTTSLIGNPRLSADNLNDFTYPGTSLGSQSFPTNTGSTVSTVVTGPFAGNDASTSAVTVSDSFRHYNAVLQNVPAGDTVYMSMCGRLGVDASEYSGGASLSIRSAQGGAENIPIPVNQILVLPSLTLVKEVIGGTATADQFSFNINPAIGGQTVYNIPSGESSVFIDNISPDGNYTVTENGPANYQFVNGSGTNCIFVGSNATASVSAGKPPVNASCTFVNEYNPGSISGYKWKDINGNGVWDSGELGLENWQINLAGSATATTTTNSTGYYQFTNLNPGTYNISETQKIYWIQTYPTNNIHNVNLSAGQNIANLNFGNKPGTCQLNITKSVDKTTAAVGDTLTYTLNYSNNGTAKCTGTGVKIYDPLNTYLNYVSGSKTITITNDGGNLGTEPGQGDDYNGKDKTLLYNVREVVPGESGVITFQVIVNTPTICCDFEIPNKAKIWSNETGDLWSNEVKTNVHMDCHATLKVIKHVINDNGGTKVASDFTMNVTGTNVSDPSFPGDEQGTEVTLSAGSYSVDEDEMTGYAKSFSGNCSGTVANGDYKTCTITNDDIQPKLTVSKIVVNDNGGTAIISDFPLFVNATGVTSGVQNGFNAGSYTVSETNKNGYTPAITGDCAADGSVTLNVGDVKSCTITNDDNAAKLVVTKHVINDNGGNKLASNFTMNVTGSGATPNSFAGDESGTEVILNAGSYSVDESAMTGYAKTIGADCSGTIANGETKYCTITNDDIAPKLKLIKTVTNDNGGTKEVSDFPLFIDQTKAVSGEWNTLAANIQYTASETSDPGYQASEWSGDCNRNGTITLQPGDEKICYITNNDIQPKLTVIKHVINDFGGTAIASDFTMFVTGNSVLPASFPGSETGTQVMLNQGAYDVTEGYFPGYAPVFGTDCTGTINVGEEKTCTVTNSSELAHLIVIKDAINDNGGNQAASDFLMTIHGVTAQTGNSFAGQEDPGTDKVVTPGSYWVTETELPGYAANYSSDCSGTIALGQTKICTITNDDVAPTITLDKVVINNHGGQAGENSFGLTIGGAPVASGIALTVMANTPYALNEAGLPDYEFVSLTGDAKCPSVLGGTVTLNEGENISCTITNDDKPSKITGYKFEDINGNGVWDQDEPTLNDWEICLTMGGIIAPDQFSVQISRPICVLTGAGDWPDGYYEFNNLSAGPYSVAETLQPGWTQTLQPQNITLEINQVSENNNFGNFKNIKISGYKFNDLNGNGIWDNGEPGKDNWLINLNISIGIRTDSNGYYEYTDLGPGTYIIAETGLPGWIPTYPVGPNNYTINAVSGVNAENINFGNFQLGKISGYKLNDINGNGVWDQDEPTLNDWEICLTMGGIIEPDQFSVLISEPVCVLTGAGDWPDGYYEFDDLNYGTYQILETQQIGWTQTRPVDPNTYTVNVISGTDSQGNDFGNFKNIDVTICKYIDVNGDGYLTDEPTYMGWKVYLNSDDELTGENGCYTFADIGPGNYDVTEEVKNGWMKTYPAQNSYNFNAVSGQNETFNFGNFQLGKISGYKYDDLGNKLNDWKICLISGGYTDNVSDLDFGVTVIQPENCKYTGAGEWADGYYEFTGLPAGTYNLVETLQNGWRAINPASGQYSDLAIASGASLSKDFINQKMVYEIKLSKADSPDPVSPGAFITYTLNWSVAGNTKVTNLTLTDPLPANTIFSSVANNGVYNETTKTITWSLGEKNPGDSGTVTFVVKALPNLHNGTIITNKATLDSSETDPVEAPATTTITSAPILNIEKTVDLAYANPGNIVTYTVVVSNTGNETAYEVVLTDTLPAGFTFNPEGTATKSWPLGDLLPGGSKTVNYPVNVGKSVIAGFYDNLAEASAKNHGKVSDKATVEVRIPSILSGEAFPEIALTKIVDKSSVNPNSLLNYTITVRNNGEATAYNVILTDKLPAGFTFTDTGLAEKTWKLGNMNPGSSQTLNYEVLVGKDVKAGNYNNLATVTADNNDPITASVNVTVKQGVVLGITGPKWYEIFYYLLGLIFVFGGIKSYQMVKRQEIRLK